MFRTQWARPIELGLPRMKHEGRHDASGRSYIKDHGSTYSRICFFCLGSLSIDSSQSFGAGSPESDTLRLQRLHFQNSQMHHKDGSHLRSDVDMLYRIQHSLMDRPIERLYLQVSDSHTRGPAKFFQERITDTTHSNSFFPRTVRDWNRLSSSGVCSIPGWI